jgi:hypothetical protein
MTINCDCPIPPEIRHVTDDPKKTPPLDHLPDMLSAVFIFSVLPLFHSGYFNQSYLFPADRLNPRCFAWHFVYFAAA